jgi:CheY-like chemotaxis protein
MTFTLHSPEGQDGTYGANYRFSNSPLSLYQQERLQQYTAQAPILFCDDDPMSRKLYHAIMQHNSLKSMETHDGSMVLRICAQMRISLVLSDIIRPAPDGLETLALLRANPKTQHIPVILVTGSSMTHEQAVQNKAQALIEKPCHPNTILQAIWQLLSIQFL